MENSIDDIGSGVNNYSINSSEQNVMVKGKKVIKVEKIGESEEYDQSLLKRRKKKLQGKGITVSLPK